jgi:hypothetical protein
MQMTKWSVIGRILPERVPLTISIPEQTVNLTDFALSYRVKINIADSQLIASVNIAKGKVDPHTLRNCVESDVRAVTDLVGYLRGCSFGVDITSMISSDGECGILGINVPVLAEARKDQKMQIEDDLLTSVLSEQSAHLALADFREAMRNPVETGFFCYRAIEAMMQSLKNNLTDNDDAAWKELRTRLRVERSAIDRVKKHSDYPRHGKPFSISDADRETVFLATNKILERFFEYLRRGKVPLPETEFPPFA